MGSLTADGVSAVHTVLDYSAQSIGSPDVPWSFIREHAGSVYPATLRMYPWRYGGLVLPQIISYLSVLKAFQHQLEYLFHKGSSLCIYEQVIVVHRIFYVPVWRHGGFVLALMCSGGECRLYLLGIISAVELVDHVLDSSKVVTLGIGSVNAIIYGDISDAAGRKQYFCILAHCKVIPAKPGQVFSNDSPDPVGIDIIQHGLKSRSVKV